MAPSRPLPTRRRLLQGAALSAVPSALVLAVPALAETPGTASRGGAGTQRHAVRAAGAARDQAVDYPSAESAPASTANYTASSRPESYPVDHVVIHVAQETWTDTLAIFRNSAKQVSAHYVVRSADGHIAQCVRERDVAWHAANWDYNTRSIGIEHEGWIDQPKYFTDAMYEQSAALTADICSRYGIPRDREHIIGHAQVPGSDHTDPGPHWDWTRYIRMVNFM